MTVLNVDMGTKIGLLISYYMVLSFWAAQTLSMSMLSRNIGGQTKKSVVVAMNFIAWAVGNAIGPQVFLGYDAPRYFIAFATHMGCYVLLVLVIVFLRWWLVRCNREKDELAAAGDRDASDDHLVHAFDDLTDRVSQASAQSFQDFANVAVSKTRTFAMYIEEGEIFSAIFFEFRLVKYYQIGYEHDAGSLQRSIHFWRISVMIGWTIAGLPLDVSINMAYHIT